MFLDVWHCLMPTEEAQTEMEMCFCFHGVLSQIFNSFHFHFLWRLWMSCAEVAEEGKKSYCKSSFKWFFARYYRCGRHESVKRLQMVINNDVCVWCLCTARGTLCASCQFRHIPSFVSNVIISFLLPYSGRQLNAFFCYLLESAYNKNVRRKKLNYTVDLLRFFLLLLHRWPARCICIFCCCS